MRPQWAPAQPRPVTANPNGTYTVTWTLGHLAPNAETTITFPVANRVRHQGSGQLRRPARS